jgi:XRE family transcriptional regulator, regulator of sulfur utilization
MFLTILASMRSNAKLPKIISKRIKKLRGELGLTQEDLAEKVGVSRVYVGYVEQGRNTPSLEILEKIAKALKSKLSDLLE